MCEEDDPELMPRMFAVGHDGEEFSLDLPPLSGQEYLRRVQKEAMSVPDVVVAEIDTGLLKNKQTVGVRHTQSGILPAPHGYAAPVAVQDRQAAHFSHVRQKLVNAKKKIKRESKAPPRRLPLKDDVEHWCGLCFGRYQSARAKNLVEASFREGHGRGEGQGRIQGEEKMDTSACDTLPDKGTPPLLSIIAYMDQPTVMQVLEYHVNWFEATGFTVEQGRWFYALLSCLEKPLVPEASFLLRGLARNCASLRATLASPEDPILHHLNLLICLVVRYFDQRDLDDNG